MEPNRKTQRKKDYDYSQPGYYSVTICTRLRSCLFGAIHNGKMLPSDAGQMVQDTWNEIPTYYPGIELDAMQIMPNHLHGIIIIRAGVWSLSDVIKRFKSLTTKRYIDGVNNNGWHPFPGKLWQRSFHDRIIRNETELNHIRKYICNNPNEWDTDDNNIDLK